jgi:thiosulfate reductase cytochrome b subunit
MSVDYPQWQSPPYKPTARQRARLHPMPLRIIHWINAVAIFNMIGSGWRIYNDDILFGWLRFLDFLVIGKWAQYGLGTSLECGSSKPDQCAL